MAIFDLAVKMQDDFGRQTTRRFQADELDYATMLTVATGFLADLAALTQLEILEYRVSQGFSYSDAVVSGANVDAGITLSVLKTDNQKAVLKVPEPTVGVVLSDGTVDLSSALVTDYVDNWITGNFKISDGEDVASLLSGKLDK